MVEIKGKDRISPLSNTLLSIILSFLDVKTIVRTTILSKRWKYVWTKVPVLDFAACHPPNNSLFISFVYRALVLNNAPKLKLFRLCNVDDIEELHLHSWIWSLMRRCVLEISLCSIKGEKILIEGLFLSDNLRVLNLSGKFTFHVTVLYFKLPNLEILNLSGVILKDSTLDISSVFPNLRELVLCNCSGTKILKFHSSSLRKLKIKFFMLPARGLNIQSIVIEAPKLEYLFLSDILSFYDIKGVNHSLTEAKINVRKQSCGMVALLQQISGVRTLRLSIETISQSLENLDPHKLPVFHNLTCLELADGTCSFVLHMLDHTPNLVSLIVHKHNYSEDWTDYWNPLPFSTPKCLSKTLKTIEFHDFCGFKEQVKIGEYFLRTAAKLRLMKIHTTHRDEEEELMALLRLFKVPRVSSTCEFIICTPGMNRF